MNIGHPTSNTEYRMAMRARSHWAFGVRRSMFDVPLALLFALFSSFAFAQAQTISVVVPDKAAPRVIYGAERIVEALLSISNEAGVVQTPLARGRRIYVNDRAPDFSASESFTLDTSAQGS